ncbi:MAG: glycosyltransferase, partial [Gammaproteobacteria bacterium]
AKIAHHYGLKVDISSKREDRMYGQAWFDFLSNAKAVLGAESGSNLFDFDGTVQKLSDKFCASNKQFSDESEEIYIFAEKAFLSKYEGNINYAQISPRHLEAAATRTVQILYEGEYSNLLRPYLHYLPLKRDLSNFNEIVANLKDEKLCTQIINNAYDDLIMNHELSYEFFADKLNQMILKILTAKNISYSSLLKRNQTLLDNMEIKQSQKNSQLLSEGAEMENINNKLIKFIIDIPHAKKEAALHYSLSDLIANLDAKILNLADSHDTNGVHSILENYSIVIIHNSAIKRLSKYSKFNKELQEFNGIKVAFIQENEINNSFEVAMTIGKYKFDLLVTPLPEYESIKFYPIELTGAISHLSYANRIDDIRRAGKTAQVTSFITQIKEKLLRLANKKKISQPNIELLANRFKTSNDKLSYKVKVAFLAAHQLHLDPRVNWLTEGFDTNYYDIYAFGIDTALDKCLPVFKGKTNNIKKYETKFVYDFIFQTTAIWDKLSDQFKEIINSLYNESLNKNDPTYTQAQQDFAWLCYHVYHTTCSFVSLISRFSEFNLIVAVDCNGLLAGAILSELYDIPLVYDAHEYWAEAFLSLDENARNYWRNIEGTLVKKYVDIAITVSPQLSNLFKEIYGKPYYSLPNAETLAALAHSKNIKAPALPGKDTICKFLFQGGYAPGRGIEKIISLWLKTPENCYLYLRGPYNQYSDDYKKIAKNIGLLNKRVFFLDPVAENELIAAAGQGDVGVIPYEPGAAINHKFCCPNKTSQFMAAGLPILSNALDFVAQIIDDSKAGIAVNFDDEAAFLEAVNKLGNNKAFRIECGERAKKYFMEKFNWEILSKDLYMQIMRLPARQSLVTSEIDDYIYTLNNFSQARKVYVSSAKPEYILKLKYLKWFHNVLFNYSLFWLSANRKQRLLNSIKHMLRSRRKELDAAID